MRIIDVLETIFPQNGETKVTGSPCIFIVVLLSTIFRFVRRRGNLTNERKKVRVYLYGLVNWKRGGGREGGSVWEKSYMVYWILFPGFGLDRRFDRCEEREGRLYFHPYYRYVMLRSRAFTNCVTVPFLRILVSPWPPFAKSSLPDRTFDLERTISQHMDYFGREKESECVHARCTQRMGISSRNARYTLFFLKQTSENIFDLRNIWTISSFKFE